MKPSWQAFCVPSFTVNRPQFVTISAHFAVNRTAFAVISSGGGESRGFSGGSGSGEDLALQTIG